MLRLISASLYKLLWYKSIVPCLLKCVGLHRPPAYHVLPQMGVCNQWTGLDWTGLDMTLKACDYIMCYSVLCLLLLALQPHIASLQSALRGAGGGCRLEHTVKNKECW